MLQPTVPTDLTADSSTTVMRWRFSDGVWLFLADFLAVSCAFFAGGITAWVMRSAYFPETLNAFLAKATIGHTGLFFSLCFLLLLWLDTKAHYRQRLPYWEVVGNILVVACAGLVVTGFIQFASNKVYSRLWLSLSWVFVGVFLFLFRAFLISFFVRAGRWTVPCLMIGDGRTAQLAQNALRDEKEMGYAIFHVVPSAEMNGLEKPGAWRALLRSKGVRFLWLALEGNSLEKYQDQIRAIARDAIPFSIIPPLHGLPLSSLSSHHFVMHDVMLMHDSNRLRLPLPCFVKRAFDLVFSILLLIVFAPFMFFFAFAVRTDGGPAFFVQKRIGRNGRRFGCIKFRTMHSGAEDLLKRHLAADIRAAEEWQRYQKLKNDPRITRWGLFLRKTSLDELPQLLNVIKGDMSLVGPRPIMPGQDIFYGDDLASYTAVRPGITGPWQVAGRNRLTIAERVELEAWYARNWTLWLDVVIILKTFPALLRRGMAF